MNNIRAFAQLVQCFGLLVETVNAVIIYLLVPSGDNISAFVTSTEFGRVEFLYCCKTTVIQLTCKICHAEASCPKELAQLILVAKPISPWKSVFCLPFREVFLDVYKRQGHKSHDKR